MTDAVETLRAAHHVVVQDYPDRGVPDSLTCAGFTVTIYGGPDPADVVVCELVDGSIVHRRRGAAATVRSVTCLILLNGPPGIGKSTLSALYTDRHPGTLNLDIDSLHRLVGGWQDPENRTHDVLRPVALVMASTHLERRPSTGSIAVRTTAPGRCTTVGWSSSCEGR